MIKDYYEIMGLTRSASSLEICKQYKKLSLQWHPDRGHDDTVHAFRHFCDINEAFDVLIHSELRAKYDLLGYTTFKNGYMDSKGNYVPGYNYLGNGE